MDLIWILNSKDFFLLKESICQVVSWELRLIFVKVRKKPTLIEKSTRLITIHFINDIILYK